EKSGDDIDRAGGYEPQHRQGAGDVEEGDERRRNVDRTRECSPRVPNLVAHTGAELEPGKGERNRRPEVQLRVVAQIRDEGLEVERCGGRTGEHGIDAEG